MEPKPRSTSVKKADKGNPTAGGEKKDGSVKDQPNPTAKKPVILEAAPTNHEDSKPPAPEPQGPDNKENGEENDASNGAAEGSGFEGLKPLLMAAGVAVAAVAVIVGVVLLVRKK